MLAAVATRLVQVRELPLSAALLGALLQAVAPVLALPAATHASFAALYALLHALVTHAALPAHLLDALPLLTRALTALAHAALRHTLTLSAGLAAEATSAAAHSEETSEVALAMRLVGELRAALGDRLRKYAPYLLAELVQAVTRQAVPRSVRALVNGACFELMDVCTRHEHAMLFAALSPAAQAVYRALHGEYEHEHRFKGKV